MNLRADAKFHARLVVFLAGLLLLWPSQFIPVRAEAFSPRWRWSNPAPHGNHIYDLAHAGNFWVQVCDRGRIYSSVDLVNWASHDTPTTHALRAAAFLDSRLIITGEMGAVLYADSLSDIQAGTLNDGPTQDWLEGVAVGNRLAVAVGDNGAVYTSTNGIAWTRQTVSFANWLRGVAFGSGKFVAVGEGGIVAKSQNGMEWQKKVVDPAMDFNRVCWLDTFFLACGSAGKLYSSPNGENWTSTSSETTNDLFAVAGNLGNHLIAGDQTVRLRVANTWADQTAASMTQPAPQAVYLSGLWTTNTLGLNTFLLGGRSGWVVQGFQTNETSPFLWYSLDGTIRNWLWEVLCTPDYDYGKGDCLNFKTNFFVAVGGHATIMTSGDGVDWLLQPVPWAVTNAVCLGTAANANGILIAGSQGTLLFSSNNWVLNVFTNNQVVNGQTNIVLCTNWINTIGEYWTNLPSATPNDLQGVATDGSRWVVTGGAGTILTSPDGSNWTPAASPVTTFLSSVASFPGGWVAVGDLGAIITSPDATHWTSSALATTNWIYRVRFLGDQLIAVGQNGLLLTSANGAAWTPRTTGTTRWLNDVVLVGGTYYAVGTQGAVLASSNAVDWVDIGASTSKSLYGAATKQGKLVVGGVEGVILRSQIVPIPDPVFYAYTLTRSATNAAITNRFVFSGQADQRFSLDISTNLLNWLPGLIFEIPSDTEVVIYSEAIDQPNPKEFYKLTPRP